MSPQNKAAKCKAKLKKLRFGIASQEYPAEKLTPVQGRLLKSAVKKLLNERRHSEGKREFRFEVDSAKGYLLVKCSKGSGKKIRKLFSSAMLNMKPWPGACLKLITDEKIVQSTGNTYSCRLPDSLELTWSAISKILQAQNEGLNTKKWILVKKEKFHEEKMVKAFFTIRDSSLKTVKSLGFELNYRSYKVKVEKFNFERDCVPPNDDSPGGIDEDEDLSEDVPEDHKDDFLLEPNKNCFSESFSSEQNREKSANQACFSGNSSGNSFSLHHSGNNWNQNGNSSDNRNYANKESINQNVSSGNSWGGSNRFAGSNSGNAENFLNYNEQHSTGGNNWSDRPSTCYDAVVKSENSFSLNRSSSNWNWSGNWNRSCNSNGNSSGNWNRSGNSSGNFYDNSSVAFSQQLERNNSHIQSRSGGNWNRNGNSWDGSSRVAGNGFGLSNSDDGRSSFEGRSFNNFTGGGNWSDRSSTSYGGTSNPASRNRN